MSTKFILVYRKAYIHIMVNFLINSYYFTICKYLYFCTLQNIDFFMHFIYNNKKGREIMQIFDVAIIGGGASALMTVIQLQSLGIKNIVLFEGNERLGRKLSATGNGQGNISNIHLTAKNYFSSNPEIVKNVLENFSVENLIDFFQDLGLYTQPDKVGRIYPLSKQASTVTDILRFSIQNTTTIFLNTRVIDVLPKQSFVVKTKDKEYFANNVVIATGGIASQNFGSDGFGHMLAKKFGHRVTTLTPSITRLVVDNHSIAGLKGVRVNANVSLVRKKEKIIVIQGDIVFADAMLGGDSIYKISAFYQQGDRISIDFLPDLSLLAIENFLAQQLIKNPKKEAEELLKGILHGSVARFILKKLDRFTAKDIAYNIKNYTIAIQKIAPFDLAQVTKGGVDMQEVDKNLMSKKIKNLYFTGEVLDCDGECGGYNLQWAFSSGVTVARAIAKKYKKVNYD